MYAYIRIQTHTYMHTFTFLKGHQKCVAELCVGMPRQDLASLLGITFPSETSEWNQEEGKMEKEMVTQKREQRNSDFEEKDTHRQEDDEKGRERDKEGNGERATERAMERVSGREWGRRTQKHQTAPQIHTVIGSLSGGRNILEGTRHYPAHGGYVEKEVRQGVVAGQVHEPEARRSIALALK